MIDDETPAEQTLSIDSRTTEPEAGPHHLSPQDQAAVDALPIGIRAPDRAPRTRTPGRASSSTRT